MTTTSLFGDQFCQNEASFSGAFVIVGQTTTGRMVVGVDVGHRILLVRVVDENQVVGRIGRKFTILDGFCEEVIELLLVLVNVFPPPISIRLADDGDEGENTRGGIVVILGMDVGNPGRSLTNCPVLG